MDKKYFVENKYTKDMTTGDCEKFEKNLKRVFGKLGSEDWELCHKCFMFGAKNCHKACSVVMKNLIRNGEIDSTSTVSSKPGRLVSADESIGNASYAQSSQSSWEEKVGSGTIEKSDNDSSIEYNPDDEEA